MLPYRQDSNYDKIFLIIYSISCCIVFFIYGLILASSIKNSNNNKDKSQKEITVNQEELINMLQNKDNYKLIIKDNN